MLVCVSVISQSTYLIVIVAKSSHDLLCQRTVLVLTGGGEPLSVLCGHIRMLYLHLHTLVQEQVS